MCKPVDLGGGAASELESQRPPALSATEVKWLENLSRPSLQFHSSAEAASLREGGIRAKTTAVLEWPRCLATSEPLAKFGPSALFHFTSATRCTAEATDGWLCNGARPCNLGRLYIPSKCCCMQVKCYRLLSSGWSLQCQRCGDSVVKTVGPVFSPYFKIWILLAEL